MASKRRSYKVAERIRAILAMELLEVADPRFSLVTITSVVVSSDLRSAKVYWTVSGAKERIDQVSAAFDAAGGRFKRKVAADLGTKFVPTLKYFYDDTLDTVEEVDRLLSQVRQNS